MFSFFLGEAQTPLTRQMKPFPNEDILIIVKKVTKSPCAARPFRVFWDSVYGANHTDFSRSCIRYLVCGTLCMAASGIRTADIQRS